MRELSPQPASAKRRITRRVLFLLGLGVLAVLGAAFYISCLRPSVGAGPAGPHVARDAFSTPWSSKPVMLVGLGDSITAGFGARKGYSYFDRLLRNPVDEWDTLQGISLSNVLPKLTTTNLAVSGSVSQDVLQHQLPLLGKTDAEVVGIVVMTTGGNDLIHNYGKTPARELAMYGASWEQAQPWIKNYEERLEQILSTISERFPGGCHICG